MPVQSLKRMWSFQNSSSALLVELTREVEVLDLEFCAVFILFVWNVFDYFLIILDYETIGCVLFDEERFLEVSVVVLKVTKNTITSSKAPSKKKKKVYRRILFFWLQVMCIFIPSERLSGGSPIWYSTQIGWGLTRANK